MYNRLTCFDLMFKMCIVVWIYSKLELRIYVYYNTIMLSISVAIRIAIGWDDFFFLLFFTIALLILR
jgi:hypothetical protein